MKDKGRRDYTLNPTSRGPTNRVQFTYASCGFAASDMYWTDELAYGAELKRRETQKTRDWTILRRPLETSTLRPLVA